MTAVAGRVQLGPRVYERPSVTTRRALIAWVSAVAGGIGAALAVRAGGARISIDAPPLHGHLAPTLGTGVIAPCVVACAVIVAAPRVIARAPWRRVLVVSTSAGAAWAIALAAVRGADRIVSPVRGPREYLAALPQVHGLLAFLGDFVDRIRDYPVHVQGHPPGTVLVLAALRDLGAGGPSWAAALFIAGGAAAIPAVLVAVRDVSGEAAARRAAPFLVLAPAAIWVATSADALYAGVATWGAALLVVATGSRGTRSDIAAAAGGLLLAAAAFGSYGMVLAAVVPVTVAVHRRRLRPLIVAGIAAAVVALVFAAAGFVWVEGFAATRERYGAGIASRRPYVPFLLIDLAALAVALGPATAVAIARLRDRTLWTVVGAAILTVAIADISGMAKGEVERIWLPFTPWLLAAGVTLIPATNARARSRLLTAGAGWLALQACAAIALESVVRTPW
jgi:hypothetical protein